MDDESLLDLGNEICLKSAGFRNLSSLQLLNLQGPESILLSDLVYTLRACPQLTFLGLGKQCEPYDELGDSFVVVEDGMGMLEKLCIQYSAGGKSDPLPLRTLRLGTCFSPCKSESNNNYLAKLVKPEDLRNLHLWNGDYHKDEDDEEFQVTKIHWALFDSSTILNLQLTILDTDALEWLNDKKSVQVLILVEQYRLYRPTIRNLPKLCLPRLGTLQIRDDTHSSTPHLPINLDPIPGQTSGSDDETQTDSLTAVENPISTSETDPKVIWSDTDFDAIPDPRVQQRATILDVLHHKGVELEQLAISIHFESQFCAFVRHLKHMPRLRYLRMMPSKIGRYPPPSASHWPNVTRSKDIAFCYVKFLKSVCPSLRYIKIGENTWQIVPKWCQEKSFWDGFDYIYLEQEEELHIDILTYESYAENSGLLGADRIIERISDETLKRVEENIAASRAGEITLPIFGDEDEDDWSESDSDSMNEEEFAELRAQILGDGDSPFPESEDPDEESLGGDDTDLEAN